MNHRKQRSSLAPANTPSATDPSHVSGKLKQVGGSRSDDWNNQIIDDTLRMPDDPATNRLPTTLNVLFPNNLFDRSLIDRAERAKSEASPYDR